MYFWVGGVPNFQKDGGGGGGGGGGPWQDLNFLRGVAGKEEDDFFQGSLQFLHKK